MPDFHYSYIKIKHGDKAKMLQTYTDSLMYICEAQNFYEDFHKDKTFFNLSNYTKYLKCCNISNNFVVGKMNDFASKNENQECILSSYEKIMNLKKQKLLIKILFVMSQNKKTTKMFCSIGHI